MFRFGPNPDAMAGVIPGACWQMPEATWMYQFEAVVQPVQVAWVAEQVRQLVSVQATTWPLEVFGPYDAGN